MARQRLSLHASVHSRRQNNSGQKNEMCAQVKCSPQIIVTQSSNGNNNNKWGHTPTTLANNGIGSKPTTGILHWECRSQHQHNNQWGSSKSAYTISNLTTTRNNHQQCNNIKSPRTGNHLVQQQQRRITNQSNAKVQRN